MQKLTVLGATGSIGINVLDVVSQHPKKFKIFALTCNTRVVELSAQCEQFKPYFAVVTDISKVKELKKLLKVASPNTIVLVGTDGLCKVASDKSVDTVVAAIVGSAGLLPTLEAAESGKKILLANKESLVMAGSLLMEAVNLSGGILMPIDSEHNAIYQCLPDQYVSPKESGVSKVLLTASGGPFRSRDKKSMREVTVDEACAHPNWKMGRKISVDSATMMNKGLEFIEACLLFGLSPDQIEVVIHPQSIVHSMVEYLDGSTLAQLSNPDMRTPIAHALAWPKRVRSGVSSLDIVSTKRLDFEPPDFERFPCLSLAISAARAGGSAPIVLNASNEVAVNAFLNNEILFTQISEVVELALKEVVSIEPNTLKLVQSCDRKTRDITLKLIKKHF
ncbi:MAG: 1-deoxy-D-xylulose-5-phosphate reductoisomerase [Porticoccus sp.]|jgi:1-deoxy-D-xylulose-5-phosphate reductoisomerase|nr:1-deoxy-D-xylulose-5-phosphate reductoisomerase [Porticoccus sp.]